MIALHETQINKPRRIVGYTLTVLASLMILMSGILKISGAKTMVENMAKIPNFSDIIGIIGVLELACLALYWIPKTSTIGFFLLCSYGGGIIVAEIVSGGVPLTGILVTTLFYVGTMLRKPSLSGLES